MKSIVPIMLIIVGLGLAVMGVNAFQESTANVSFLGLDINASDEGGQMTGILYFVLGAICLVLGGLRLKKGK